MPPRKGYALGGSCWRPELPHQRQLRQRGCSAALYQYQVALRSLTHVPGQRSVGNHAAAMRFEWMSENSRTNAPARIDSRLRRRSCEWDEISRTSSPVRIGSRLHRRSCCRCFCRGSAALVRIWRRGQGRRACRPCCACRRGLHARCEGISRGVRFQGLALNQGYMIGGSMRLLADCGSVGEFAAGYPVSPHPVKRLKRHHTNQTRRGQ